MAEYERLLKVCREGHNAYLKDQNPNPRYDEFLANYLLKNNVIALPCAIGTQVYGLAQPCGSCSHYNSWTKKSIDACQNCKSYEIIKCKFEYDLIPEFGKTVFLTEEEVKEALENIKEIENESYSK